MPANTVIKLRRGTQAQWSSADPVLAAGEVGIETDTVSFKFGDGTLAWSELPYAGGSEFTGSVDWINVLNKPSEFTPEAHTHSISEVVDLQTELDGKSDVGHTHTKSDITDFAHTHTISEITDYDRTDGTVLSDTAPTGAEGLRWIKTTTMQEYVFYDSVWVEV